MAAIIKVENLSKEYKSKNFTVRALDQVNFTVEDGKIAVLIGRSGSGKTTLLNVLGGLLEPDSGSVQIDGDELYKSSGNIFNHFSVGDSKRADIRNRKIGYVYQNINLINELNVLENIRLPFDIAGRKYDLEYEKEVISMLGLEERLRFYPNQLSGGERQRAAIARALIKKPAIVLADEPNGNIDSKAGKDLMEYVKQSNQKLKQTFLIVTHDLDWLEYADEVFEIIDGKIELYKAEA